MKYYYQTGLFAPFAQRNYKQLILAIAAVFMGAFAFMGLSARAAETDTYTLGGGASAELGGVKLVSNGTDAYSTLNFDLDDGTTVSEFQGLEATFEVLEGNCGGGAPRYSIETASGNIFVYVGDAPSFNNCTTGSTGNLLDDSDVRVDTSQVGGTFYDTWTNAVALVGDEEVTGLSLVVDAGWSGYQAFLVNSATVNETAYDFVTKVLAGKDECKNGGWMGATANGYTGTFKNQGHCVSHFASNGKSTTARNR